MMIRALDASGDWSFGRGSQNYLTGQDAISQNIKSRLKLWKGECFFSPDSGVDWNNLLDWGTKDLLDANIRLVILGTTGVIRMDAYSSVLTGRNLAVSATILTIYGTLTFQEEA